MVSGMDTSQGSDDATRIHSLLLHILVLLSCMLHPLKVMERPTAPSLHHPCSFQIQQHSMNLASLACLSDMTNPKERP